MYSGCRRLGFGRPRVLGFERPRVYGLERIAQGRIALTITNKRIAYPSGSVRIARGRIALCVWR